MNRKFEYKRYPDSVLAETIELLSINTHLKSEVKYEGSLRNEIQHEVYKIIFIDECNELLEEEISSLTVLTPIK